MTIVSEKGRAGMNTLRTAMLIVLLLALTPFDTSAQSKPFTEWGWPQPYEQVSPKSVEWLKAQPR